MRQCLHMGVQWKCWIYKICENNYSKQITRHQNLDETLSWKFELQKYRDVSTVDKLFFIFMGTTKLRLNYREENFECDTREMQFFTFFKSCIQHFSQQRHRKCDIFAFFVPELWKNSFHVASLDFVKKKELQNRYFV